MQLKELRTCFFVRLAYRMHGFLDSHTRNNRLQTKSHMIPDGLLCNALRVLYRMNDFGTNGGPPLKALEIKMELFKSHVSSSFGFELPQVDVSTSTCQRVSRLAFVL